MTAIQHVVAVRSGNNHHYVCNAAKNEPCHAGLLLGTETGFADKYYFCSSCNQQFVIFSLSNK
jgi:hypothetical protein